MNSASLCLALFIGLLSVLGIKCACINFPGEPCIHNNIAYRQGQWWSNDACQDCLCHRHSDSEPRGYHCCDIFTVPIYDETKCKAVFDEETCSYKLSPIEDSALTTNDDPSSSSSSHETSWSSWMLPSWFEDQPDCGQSAFGVGK